ncbi:hypothetical protein MTO96_017001 [Rhipicephalus appendiculatus]
MTLLSLLMMMVTAIDVNGTSRAKTRLSRDVASYAQKAHSRFKAPVFIPGALGRQWPVPGLQSAMSVWDIEVEEVSGPWYPLERDGTPTEDAETDSEDDEKRHSFDSTSSDDERSRSRGSERFRRSPAPMDKRSGPLKLAHAVAPDLYRCAFDAGYVYLLTLLVEGTPSEHSALRQLLYEVHIPVAILFRAHLFVATTRLVSWSIAKLRAVEDGLVSTALFLLVLVLAVLLLTACSIHFVLMTRGIKVSYPVPPPPSPPTPTQRDIGTRYNGTCGEDQSASALTSSGLQSLYATLALTRDTSPLTLEHSKWRLRVEA